jgi:hypothetical protein
LLQHRRFNSAVDVHAHTALSKWLQTEGNELTPLRDNVLNTIERKLLELKIECEIGMAMKRAEELGRQLDSVGKPPVPQPGTPAPWLK